jgi:hypothetical protein
MTVFALKLDAPGSASGSPRLGMLLICDSFTGPALALTYRAQSEDPRDVIARHLAPVPVMPVPIKCTWQYRQQLLREYGIGKRQELVSKLEKP